MNNKNEQYEQSQLQRQKLKKKFQIIGFTLLGIGCILSIISSVDFISYMSNLNFENSFGGPRLFWCLGVGLILNGVGIMFLIMGFRKEVMRYVKNEEVPIINETSREISPAIENISSSIQKGFTKEDSIRCICGQTNEADSKFCKNCGKQLLVVCPNCAEELSQDSKYCNNCGVKL